jgi:hypothetical protein
MLMANSGDNGSRSPIKWSVIDSWRRLTPAAIQRLPKKMRADMEQRVAESAESRQAETRLDDLTVKADKQVSPTGKKVTQIIVSVVGALTFSAGAQVLTSRLGAVALPAAITVGGLASYLVDDRAAKVITKARSAHSAKQTIASVKTEQLSLVPANELDELFDQSHLALVQKIEGPELQKQLGVDVIVAGGMSAAEFTVSIWIVTQLGLPGGILVEAIAAGLPVMMIWIAAAFQSDKFEMPQHYAELMEKYKPHLLLGEKRGLPAAKYLGEKKAEEARIDYLVKFVANGDPGGRLKNLGMAEADYDIRVLREQKHQLEQQRDREIAQKWGEHKHEVANLPRKFPVPEVDTVGLPPEQIKIHQQKTELRRGQWVQEKKEELKNTLEEALQIIAVSYETKIKQCEEELNAAQQRYDEARDNWSDDYLDLAGHPAQKKLLK